MGIYAKLIVNAAAACFSLSAASAQPLDVAVRDGVRTNPALLAETARVEAAAEAIAEARAAGLPNVTLTGRSNYATGSFDPGAEGQAALDAVFSGLGGGSGGPPPIDIEQFAGAGDGLTTNQAELAVTQPIFTGFRIYNGIKEAQAAVRGARAQLVGAKQGLAFQIVDGYLRVVSAEAEIEAVQKSVESLSQALRAAELSFEAGRSTKTDVALAEAQLAAAQAQLAGAQAQAIAARQSFSVLGGDEIQRFSLPDAPMDVPSSSDEALSLALAQHPSLAAAAAEREAAQSALRGARGSRSPSLRLRGAYGYTEGQFLEGDSAENVSIAAELSFPLFEGGAISAGIRRASANLRAARFAETNAQRDVTANVRSAYAAYEAATRGAEAAAARRTAAELAWKGIQLERDVGQRSILDVLRVEEDLLAAQVGDVNAKADVIRASWQVALTTGTLEVD